MPLDRVEIYCKRIAYASVVVFIVIVFGSIKQIIDIWYTRFHIGLYTEKHIL